MSSWDTSGTDDNVEWVRRAGRGDEREREWEGDVTELAGVAGWHNELLVDACEKPRVTLLEAISPDTDCLAKVSISSDASSSNKASVSSLSLTWDGSRGESNSSKTVISESRSCCFKYWSLSMLGFFRHAW